MTAGTLNRLLLQFRTALGTNEQQSVPITPDSITRFNSMGQGVSDPIMSGLDTFSRQPATATDLASTTKTLQETLDYNPDFLLSGTANAFTIRDANKGGMWVYTTAPAETAMLVAMTASRFYVRVANRSMPVWECRCSVSRATGLYCSIGLSQNATSPDATLTGGSHALFLYDPDLALTTGLPLTSAQNWILVTNSAGVVSFQDSGVKVFRASDQTFRIEFDNERRPAFFIDGVQVGARGAAVGAVDMKSFVGITQTGVDSVSVQLRYMFCGRSFG